MYIHYYRRIHIPKYLCVVYEGTSSETVFLKCMLKHYKDTSWVGIYIIFLKLQATWKRTSTSSFLKTLRTHPGHFLIWQELQYHI